MISTVPSGPQLNPISFSSSCTTRITSSAMLAANMNLFLLTLLSLPSSYLAAPHPERRAAVTCTNPWIGSYTALAAYSPMASYCSSLFPVPCTSTVPATTTNDFFADRRAVKTTLSPAESSASVQFVSAKKLAKTSKSTLCVCYGYQTTAVSQFRKLFVVRRKMSRTDMTRHALLPPPLPQQ